MRLTNNEIDTGARPDTMIIASQCWNLRAIDELQAMDLKAMIETVCWSLEHHAVDLDGLAECQSDDQLHPSIHPFGKGNERRAQVSHRSMNTTHTKEP